MITFFFLLILLGVLIFITKDDEEEILLKNYKNKDPFYLKNPPINKTPLLEEFWTHAFNFKGKTTRRDFWITQGLLFLLYILLISISICLYLDFNFGDLLYIGLKRVGPYIKIPTFVVSIISLIPSISIQVRRLRDVGRNPLWILISLIPLIGGIILLIFYLSPSKEDIRQTKLEGLEELLSKGTIDEEEYKYMRKQILMKFID